jgi:hypothetical protein
LERISQSAYSAAGGAQGRETMTAPTLSKLKVKLFTDGADKAQIVEMARQPWIAGFTTNRHCSRRPA